MRFLKSSLDAGTVAPGDAAVQETVRELIEAVRTRGDAAVRERFDGWSPPSFRLPEGEIEAGPHGEPRGAST